MYILCHRLRSDKSTRNPNHEQSSEKKHKVMLLFGSGSKEWIGTRLKLWMQFRYKRQQISWVNIHTECKHFKGDSELLSLWSFHAIWVPWETGARWSTAFVNRSLPMLIVECRSGPRAQRRAQKHVERAFRCAGTEATWRPHPSLKRSITVGIGCLASCGAEMY